MDLGITLQDEAANVVGIGRTKEKAGLIKVAR